MTRKIIDCRAVPNDVGCTLAITGEPGELITAAAQHAVTGHGHADTPKLRDHLRGMLADEPAISQPGAFVQLIEFDTDRIGEWDAIADRWAGAIGPSAPCAGPSSAPTATGRAAHRRGGVPRLHRGDGQLRSSGHRGVPQGAAVHLPHRAGVP